MFDSKTIAEITKAAEEHGISPDALLAVAEVETGGRAFAMVGGREEPLIRFEGHYFDRRLSGAERDRARAAGLASPQAGAIANPSSQASRWALLDRAVAINRQAACESTLWGLGQVMGAHWAWLGFGSVDSLVEEARSGAYGQARLAAIYIVKAGLSAALANQDWAAFARGYNGPGYRANAYDTKIARAFARHSARHRAPELRGPTGVVRRGDRGEHVADLQTALGALGHPLVRDGIFGAATERAVRAFQKDKGLTVDGIVGPITQAALREALRPSGFLQWLTGVLNWLRPARI